MSWTVAASLLGVIIGALLTRRSQSRHWLKDTKAAAYRTVLHEYARIEFDVRKAYLGTMPVTDLDWARWGGALAELTLVGDPKVVASAQRVADALVRMERYVHSGEKDDDAWRDLLRALAATQAAFVNAARKSLDRTQPSLDIQVGGPLIDE